MMCPGIMIPGDDLPFLHIRGVDGTSFAHDGRSAAIHNSLPLLIHESS